MEQECEATGHIASAVRSRGERNGDTPITSPACLVLGLVWVASSHLTQTFPETLSRI